MYIKQFSMICNVDFDLYRAVIQFSYRSGKYSLKVTCLSYRRSFVMATLLLKNKMLVQTKFNDELKDSIQYHSFQLNCYSWNTEKFFTVAGFLYVPKIMSQYLLKISYMLHINTF